MAILYLLGCSFFGYLAGACAQGMNQQKYRWKKDLLVLFLLLLSFYFGIVLVGRVSLGE